MKDNFENNIKESLNGFEVPYDATAWTAISKRLDQAMPVSGNSNLKWYLGGAATVAVIVTTALLWPSTDVEKSQHITSTSTEKVKETEDQVHTSKGTSSHTTIQDASSIEAPEKNTSNGTSNPVSFDPAPNIFDNPIDYIKTKENTYMNEDEPVNSIFDPIIEMVAPTVPSVANICLNESTTINNPNKQELTVVGPNGITTIKGNSSLQYTPDSEGIYNLGFMVNGIFNSKESFVVKPLPKVDFTIDETYHYENGVPSINLATNSQGVAHVWNFEGQNGTTTGTEAKAHFFYKGEYDITLTVTGSNSCKSSVAKSVQIEETYNLLAVNGFDPMSGDNRINSFIPRGLVERSADFRMIIIDPTDGAIIFETNDVSNPWRGLDKRNGQMVSANKAFIWKVTLNNPLKGENPEYKGTIVRL
ncbi:MAG: hypothetical protein RI922_2241 [Bacteroidota bacterium]|jgi:hypothetical protein